MMNLKKLLPIFAIVLVIFILSSPQWLSKALNFIKWSVVGETFDVWILYENEWEKEFLTTGVERFESLFCDELGWNLRIHYVKMPTGTHAEKDDPIMPPEAADSRFPFIATEWLPSSIGGKIEVDDFINEATGEPFLHTIIIMNPEEVLEPTGSEKISDFDETFAEEVAHHFGAVPDRWSAKGAFLSNDLREKLDLGPHTEGPKYTNWYELYVYIGYSPWMQKIIKWHLYNLPNIQTGPFAGEEPEPTEIILKDELLVKQARGMPLIIKEEAEGTIVLEIYKPDIYYEEYNLWYIDANPEFTVEIDGSKTIDDSTLLPWRWIYKDGALVERGGEIFLYAYVKQNPEQREYAWVTCWDAQVAKAEGKTAVTVTFFKKPSIIPPPEYEPQPETPQPPPEAPEAPEVSPPPAPEKEKPEIMILMSIAIVAIVAVTMLVLRKLQSD